MAGNEDVLVPLDSLIAEVLSDNVSDTYVTKTPFARAELANVVDAGAKVISGQNLLVANLGYGLRLTSRAGSVEHLMLFDTDTEGAAFMRNCANLGIGLGAVEEIAITHGHWDHNGGAHRRDRRNRRRARLGDRSRQPADVPGTRSR
ncbi:hypothetical protein [Mycobacterium sp.]|uniref:hypothetical protein n=1 Tax=Mycobacterium sp. TaxID=1785 RepID=UPI003F95B32A